MKKPSAVAEAIAKKAFRSAPFQQDWQIHLQAFGPILEPAYPDCYTAKVHLINILNKISRRDLSGANETMETLVKSCGCDTAEEKALHCFLQGLCRELGGDKLGMFSAYIRAGQYGHQFYLLPLKCARFAHDDGELDVALSEYCKALPLIRALPDSPVRTKLLGSTLTNTASCMTYMHRCEDAEALLAEARAVGPVPRIEAAEAVLMAVLNRPDALEGCLDALRQANDPDYDHILSLTRAILEGRDPHFCPQPVDEAAVAAFWQWFADQEETLRQLYDQHDEELPEAFIDPLAEHLAPCFPFEHPPIELCGSQEEERELTFFCGYHRALAAGYAAVIDACPAEIASRWQFIVEA